MICTTQRKLVSSHIKGNIFRWLLILVLLLENIFIPKTEENVFFVFFFPALFHSSICNRLMGFTFSDNLYQGRLASKVSF